MDNHKLLALFRYGLIAPVLNEEQKVINKYFREISKKEHYISHLGQSKKFKIATFKDWLRKYNLGGLDALYPCIRNDKGSSKKISSALHELIIKKINEYPFLSTSALYKMFVNQGIIYSYDFSEVTLRNYISYHKLKTKNINQVSRKRYQAPNINILWIADFMHGFYITDTKDHNKKKKTYLCAIIDDYSRYIVGSGFFYHENTNSLAKVFKRAILQHGLSKKFYCDNGSVFSTHYLQEACARIGIALIHSKPYDSPSRGKIERFFRTVRQSFFTIIPNKNNNIDLESLNNQFTKWLNDYHTTIHSSTNQKPYDRFINNINDNVERIIEEQLDLAFYHSMVRLVKKDSTISINGKIYEVPSKYIGEKIELRHAIDKPYDIFIFQNNKPISQIKLINLTENFEKPYLAIKFNQLTKDNKND